jgi:hypothetical protein
MVEMMQWREIGSVPEDTWVLLAHNSRTAPAVGKRTNGVWMRHDYQDSQSFGVELPTMWMPLPQMP